MELRNIYMSQNNKLSILQDGKNFSMILDGVEYKFRNNADTVFYKLLLKPAIIALESKNIFFKDTDIDFLYLMLKSVDSRYRPYPLSEFYEIERLTDKIELKTITKRSDTYWVHINRFLEYAILGYTIPNARHEYIENHRVEDVGNITFSNGYSLYFLRPFKNDMHNLDILFYNNRNHYEYNMIQLFNMTDDRAYNILIKNVVTEGIGKSEYEYDKLVQWYKCIQEIIPNIPNEYIDTVYIINELRLYIIKSKNKNMINMFNDAIKNMTNDDIIEYKEKFKHSVEIETVEEE